MIFIQEKRGLCGVDFLVELAGEEELKAQVIWRQAKDLLLREIKMATYHDLKIVPCGTAWEVALLFDL